MTIASTPAHPLAIIPKGKKHCVIVRLTTFQDSTRLDIRLHYRSREGEWLPSRQGVRIPCDSSLRLLIDAIREAQAQLAGGAK